MCFELIESANPRGFGCLWPVAYRRLPVPAPAFSLSGSGPLIIENQKRLIGSWDWPWSQLLKAGCLTALTGTCPSIFAKREWFAYNWKSETQICAIC